jgi:hypothetical protein
MYNRSDRARRGASGALWPTIRSSGVEFPAEASLFLAGALARGAEGWGPARRAARELRQDRKVAAVTGWSLVRQSTSPEPAARDTQGECCRSRVHGPTRSSRSERRRRNPPEIHGGGFLLSILEKALLGSREASGGAETGELPDRRWGWEIGKWYCVPDLIRTRLSLAARRSPPDPFRRRAGGAAASGRRDIPSGPGRA